MIDRAWGLRQLFVPGLCLVARAMKRYCWRSATIKAEVVAEPVGVSGGFGWWCREPHRCGVALVRAHRATVALVGSGQALLSLRCLLPFGPVVLGSSHASVGLLGQDSHEVPHRHFAGISKHTAGTPHRLTPHTPHRPPHTNTHNRHTRLHTAYTHIHPSLHCGIPPYRSTHPLLPTIQTTQHPFTSTYPLNHVPTYPRPRPTHPPYP